MDQPTEDLTATLFHRPSTAPSSTQPTHLTDTTLQALIQTLQDLHSLPPTSSTTSYETTYLDNPPHPHVARLTFASHLSLQRLRKAPELSAFEQAHSLELVLQPTHTAQTAKKLAVFDMDSTIIQQEVIDLLAAEAGVEAQVSAITARAMNGELDFAASLRERVALLRGVRADIFDSLKPRVTLTPGAEVLLRVLHALGVKTALLSGGFSPLARWVGARLGIDHVHANDLAAEGGVLTGLLDAGTVVVDAARKARLLSGIAEHEGVASQAQVLAVGDGANDLPMLWAAGLGVAVNAKPRVQADAPARLNGQMALLDVLYLMGLKSDEIDRLAEGP